MDVPHEDLVLEKRVDPRYPKGVDYAEPQRCIARVTMGADGVPTEVEVSGCPPEFFPGTREALLQWRWRPLGTPAVTSIAINYVMEDTPSAPPATPEFDPEDAPYVDVFAGVGADRRAGDEVAHELGVGWSARLAFPLEDDAPVVGVFTQEVSGRGPVGRWDLGIGAGTTGSLDGSVRVAATAGLGVSWWGLRVRALDESAAELHVPVVVSALAGLGALRLDARVGTGWPLLRSGSLRDPEPPTIPSTSGWLLAAGATWALPDERYGRWAGPALEVALTEELGAVAWRLQLGIGI